MASTQADALERELGGRFDGELLGEGSVGYDVARQVWNGMIDRRPALIARCASARDVVAVVRLARERSVPLAVRGGGHNVAGNAVCDDGVVADLSPLKGIEVDPAWRVAQAGGGVLWGELDAAAHRHGLAVTGGIQSTTGIAGFTLGGGIGWLSRRLGHACDNLLGAEVVTASGEVLRAGPNDHPDLFWALRGGGGSFGVVTRFEFALHPIQTIVGGMVWHAPDTAAELLASLREVAEPLPDEVGVIVFFVNAPDTAAFPDSIRGRPAVALGVCASGDEPAALEAVASLRRLGRPLADTVCEVPYPEHQRMVDAANPPGERNYWQAEYLRALDDGVISALASFGGRRPSPLSKILLTRLGGAAGRVPEDGAAFAHRGAPYLVNINAMFPDPALDREATAWARECWEAVRPASWGGVYINFLGAEGEERVRAAYGPAKFARLAEVKRRYDPDNLFRLNQNIPPAGDGEVGQ